MGIWPTMTNILRRSAIVLGVAALTGLARGAEPTDLLAARGDEPTTVVCLGDSVTGVYYHTGGRRAYPEMLELALRKARPTRPTTVINAGISGHATTNGLERLDRDVLRHKPHLVTISFGLNDMVRVPPELFHKNLEELIARCRAAGSQVVLCTPNAVLDTGGRPTSKLITYCDIIRATGRDKQVPVCDQYAAGDAQRKKDAWSWRLTLSDEIHPNMDGHRQMAMELARTISGQSVSLDDVHPPRPALPKTAARLKAGEVVRVLAMPPYDAWIEPALRAKLPNAKVEVTTWPTASKSVAELERAAQATVRPFKPDLVIIAVPRDAADTGDEPFVRSYSWIMNWSLSFGLAEWDCFVAHPSVAAPEKPGPRDQLVRQLVRAQDLHLLDRPVDKSDSAELLLARWLEQALAR